MCRLGHLGWHVGDNHVRYCRDTASHHLLLVTCPATDRSVEKAIQSLEKGERI